MFSVIDGEDEDDLQVNVLRNPQAYAFEPFVHRNEVTVNQADTLNSENDSDIDSHDNDSNPEFDPTENRQSRLDNTDWCTCGYCEIMPTLQESYCCQELRLEHKLQDLGVTHKCVTENPVFNTVAINRDVLDVAMMSLRNVKASVLERPVNSE